MCANKVCAAPLTGLGGTPAIRPWLKWPGFRATLTTFNGANVKIDDVDVSRCFTDAH
jgi:hypothetical protein